MKKKNTLTYVILFTGIIAATANAPRNVSMMSEYIPHITTTDNNISTNLPYNTSATVLNNESSDSNISAVPNGTPSLTNCVNSVSSNRVIGDHSNSIQNSVDDGPSYERRINGGICVTQHPNTIPTDPETASQLLDNPSSQNIGPRKPVVLKTVSSGTVSKTTTTDSTVQITIDNTYPHSSSQTNNSGKISYQPHPSSTTDQMVNGTATANGIESIPVTSTSCLKNSSTNNR